MGDNRVSLTGKEADKMSDTLPSSSTCIALRWVNELLIDWIIVSSREAWLSKGTSLGM